MTNPFKTPLCAVARNDDGSAYIQGGDAANPPHIAFDVGCSLEEAQFIAHAVNSHDEMLAALKAILSRCNKDGEPCNASLEIDPIAFAAITKAEGRQ